MCLQEESLPLYMFMKTGTTPIIKTNKQTKQQTKKQKSERSLCPQQPGKSPEIYKNREIGGMTAEAFNVGS